MSDQKNGEPVDENVPAEESTSVDAAVASANEGLADAEAASRDAVVEEPAVASEPVEHDQPVVRDEPAPVAGSSYADDPVDEDYVPGAVHRFGEIRVTAQDIIDFARRYDPQDFHTDCETKGDDASIRWFRNNWRARASAAGIRAACFISSARSRRDRNKPSAGLAASQALSSRRSHSGSAA